MIIVCMGIPVLHILCPTRENKCRLLYCDVSRELWRCQRTEKILDYKAVTKKVNVMEVLTFLGGKVCVACSLALCVSGKMMIMASSC